MTLRIAEPMLYPLLEVPSNALEKLSGFSILRCPANAAKPQQTMKSSVNSFTADKTSWMPLPTRGATVWTPTEKTAPAMATPRSVHVVESTPAATRM